MNCQTFSIGFSSGHLGGSGTSVMLGGTLSLCERCHPAWSTSSAACAPGHGGGHLGQVQGHRRGVAAWQDERRSLAVLGADGAEDVGGGGPLILRRRRSRAAPRPAPGDLVLLADPGLISEPDLYVGRGNALGARDVVQNGGEGFLKSSTAPAAWA